ncbi:FkbM family methyltransferase [Nocardioides alcanivorans]|uniref:FkbM family methyltransferase n=1 Tax=Nocardioides alcanivorans TaxID=2897352 RepID=UPI001F0153D5|nr:FkbM family methyltransferase [Nocardioides alcanivorans]
MARDKLLTAAYRLLASRGFEVRRHPAARRQRILADRGVDLVLDVGAARGGFGQQLRDFGYHGRIVSFEPLASAYADLSGHISSDPAWTAHHTALGAEPGTATINVASNSDSSSLLPMLDAHRSAAPEVGYVDTQDVRVSRLDDLAEQALATSAATYLKVDTQGFEREVLAGAPATLAQVVGLQLELSFVPLYDGGMTVDEAVSWAYRQGFHLVGIEQGYAAPTGEILQVDGVFWR